MPAARAPQDRKPKAPKPSEVVDQTIEQDELRKELLSDLPPLRPPHRFRLAHRNAFTNLSLEALKSGAFDGDGTLNFDFDKPGDIDRYQKLQSFIESIDAWAESIADDPDAYATWSEGKTEEHALALFTVYKDALGESQSSAS